MTGRLTENEAAALGLIPKKKPRRTRKEASGPYWSMCHTCGKQFVTQAAEDRHVAETRHARYEVKPK